MEQFSHLQYADDTLIIGGKSWENVWTIKSKLTLIEIMTGLKVNYHKGFLIGINTPQIWLEEAIEVLNCKIRPSIFNYLILPIGDNPKRSDIW